MRNPTSIDDAHFGQVFTISDDSRCVLPVNEPGNEAPQKRQTNASGKSSSWQKGQAIAVSFVLSWCKKSNAASTTTRKERSFGQI